MKSALGKLAGGLLVASYSLLTYAAPGDLDGTFGIGGKLIISPDLGGPNTDRGFSVVVDGTRSYLIGDASTNTGETSTIHRILADGSPDPTFGIGGLVQIGDLGGLFDNVGLYAGVLQADKKLLVAGRATKAGNTDMLVCRFLTTGARDMTFGQSGCRSIRFDLAAGAHDGAGAITVQADGKIVVAGSASTIVNSGITRMAVARLTTNGALDINFGTLGKVNHAFPNWQTASAGAVVVDGLGRIVVGGSVEGVQPDLCNRDLALMRLLPNGSLDTQNFSGGKFVGGFDLGPLEQQQPFCGHHTDFFVGMHVKSDGSVFLAASAEFTMGFDFAAGVMKVKSNGQLDTSFGTNGRVVRFACEVCVGTTFLDFAVQADGRMLFAGATLSLDDFNYDTVVVSLLANGQDDITFQGGHTFVDFDGPGDANDDYPSAIGFQSAKPLIFGTRYPSPYTPNSSLSVVRLQN